MELRNISNEELDILREKQKHIIGDRVGKLVVSDIAGRDLQGRICVSVHCDCGNDKVMTKASLYSGVISCGCVRKENARNISPGIDMTGQRFGKLLVINQAEKRYGYLEWLCRCDCGELRVVRGSYLRCGRVTECISCARKKSHPGPEDLIGQTFNMLTPIQFVNSGKRGAWLCRCSCGGTTVVRSSHLKSGHIISCGCIKSSAEQQISECLDKHNIKYQPQKTFIGCCDKKLLRFDFWLYEYGICLEFDGQQHYQSVSLWDENCSLEDRQRHDAIKTKYCEENDIVLLRIPYWEKDNIESILSDWLFLNTEVDNDEELSEAAG